MTSAMFEQAYSININSNTYSTNCNGEPWSVVIRRRWTHAWTPPRAQLVTMVTIGGDLKPGCLADRLLTGLGQPQVNPKLRKKKKKSIVLLRKEIMNKLVVDLLLRKGLGC